MNYDVGWQCLSVREFVGRCNWDRALAVSQPSDRLKKSLTAWRCLTTRDFFTLNNWSGIAVYADDSTVNTTLVFSLTLPTNQLWQCFNWTSSSNSSVEAIAEEIIEQAEGARKDVAGVPPVVLKDTPSDKSIEQEAIAAVEEFTLNDLSQLF